MKRWFVIICIFCLLMSGCDMWHKTGESVALPDNVTMTAELPDEYPEELKVYKAEWALRDGEYLIDVLMRNEVSDVTEDALYRAYYAENAESENIREVIYIERIQKDGQKIVYNYRRKQVADSWLIYCLTEPEYAEAYDYAYKEYRQEGNLDFLKAEVVDSRIREKLNALGIANLDIKEYALYDMTTMQENLAIYNEMIKEYGDGSELTEYTFTKADERYWFQYQQVLDGVPFAMESKYSAKTNYRATTYVGGEAEYSARLGLEELCLENLVNVGAAVETLKVSSPQEAVQAWCDHYETEDDEIYEIQQVELCYVVRNNAYGDYAYPYWVIRTAVDYEMLQNDGWEDYRSFMIDVTTGDIL